MDFPDDVDSNVLRALVKDGVDLAKPRTVEFTIAAAVDEQDGSVSLYCATDIVLTYEAVVERQAQLNALCQSSGAECDGWLVEGSSKSFD